MVHISHNNCYSDVIPIIASMPTTVCSQENLNEGANDIKILLWSYCNLMNLLEDFGKLQGFHNHTFNTTDSDRPILCSTPSSPTSGSLFSCKEATPLECLGQSSSGHSFP